MRTAKILGYLVGGVIAVIALVMLTVWLFVNPNHYKPQIVAAVREATGRELSLTGDIKLSVFPWIALELGPASLSGPPGFGGEPFVAFRHAAVRMTLLPLLRERLEISHVDIDGLDVRLRTDASGRGNWQGFGRSSVPAGSADSAGSTESAAHDRGSGETLGPTLPVEDLAGVNITHARVSYQAVVVENLSVETSSLVDGVVPVSIHFDANRGVAGEHATVAAKLAFGSPGAGRYRVAAVAVVGQLNLAGNSRPVRWNLSTPGVDLDLNAQTVAVPVMALTVAGAQLNGSVQGTQVVDDLHLAGSVTLAPLVLREFMPRWGLKSPRTRDPRGFAQFSGSTTFVYGGNALRFDHVRVALDDTHVLGSFAVENLATRALAFDLTADAVDVDRYLAPVEGPGAGGAVGGEASAAESSRSAGGEASREESAGSRSGGEASRGSGPGERGAAPALSAAGTLAIGSVHAGRVVMRDLRLTLAMKQGVTRVFPLVALVDGGRYSGDIGWDGRGSVPTLSVDEHLNGADMGQLLATPSKGMHLSGKGNFNVKATGRGASADAILKTLSGHLDTYVTGGAVEGVDMGYQLGRAEALFKRESAPLDDTHRTRFDALKMSAQIENGIARTSDLMLSSPVLKVTGEGTANLATNAVDLHLVADTLKTLQGVPVQIPVSVTGSLSDPTIRPDMEAFAKGQLKQKLQDVLHDKLQSLFGKP